jgi:hypothetical protein
MDGMFSESARNSSISLEGFERSDKHHEGVCFHFELDPRGHFHSVEIEPPLGPYPCFWPISGARVRIRAHGLLSIVIVLLRS